MCKKKDCWLTGHIKEECNEVREGFKRYVHQYFVGNNINDNFDKDIMAIAFNILTLTAALTNTSGNFFYNNYGIEYFIILKGLIPIKTAKNIVIFMNNNAFVYSLTGSMEPSSMEPSTVRRGDMVNINFLDCYFNNNR